MAARPAPRLGTVQHRQRAPNTLFLPGQPAGPGRTNWPVRSWFSMTRPVANGLASTDAQLKGDGHGCDLGAGDRSVDRCRAAGAARRLLGGAQRVGADRPALLVVRAGWLARAGAQL